jgi:hypothetical protein
MANTKHIKLDDLRPCAKCGDTVVPILYAVEVTQGIIDAKAVNTTLGLAQMMGGNMRIATVMGPNADAVIELSTCRFFMCQMCFVSTLGSEWDGAIKSEPGSPCPT